MLQQNPLPRSTLEGFSEHQKLHLVIDRKHTGTGNTTQDIGTSTLEQRSNSLDSDNLASGIQRRLVLDGLRDNVNRSADINNE